MFFSGLNREHRSLVICGLIPRALTSIIVKHMNLIIGQEHIYHQTMSLKQIRSHFELDNPYYHSHHFFV